jgi:hypothetical protein
MALRHTVRQQFQQHKEETNPAQIETLKANAVRALSNYMLFQSAQKDDQLQKAMKNQVRDVTKMNKNKTTTPNQLPFNER